MLGKLIPRAGVALLFASVSMINIGNAAERNLVPSKDVAAQIAEAVLVPIYGKKVLKQRPFEVKENDGYWFVDGTLHAAPNQASTGGVAHIEIRKKDGLLRNVYHSM